MRRATVRWWAGVLALVIGAGCGHPGNERYVPAAPDACQALEVALRAWQDGGGPGLIETASPPVMVVDSLRRPGQALRRYEVLGEVPVDGPRQFAVRLVLDDPPEEKKVRFVVFGISPLWVYRFEDYEMMAHWECDMTTGKEPGTDPAVAR
jgi:hypothetical protein